MRETAEDDGETQPSKGIRGCPRDLLRQLSGDIRPEEPREAASGGVEDSGEIELSLGLSLGGSFGADPCRRNGLRRSSSIAFVPFLQQGGHEPGAATLLTRTCSLPVEPKEGERKRKELQCLRRMEAKRRRAENLDGTPLCGGDQADSGWVRNFRSSEFERLRGCPRLTHFGAGAGAAPPNGAAAEAFPFWVAGDGERRVAAGTRFAPASQGSVGSQGSSSSGSSDFDSRRPKQEEVGNGTTDPRGSSVVQSLADPGDEKAAAAAVRKPTNCARPAVEGDSPPSEEGGAAGCDGMRGIMEDMPCVSARGDGPNGRRVEGFLYRYGKGEEVRIVCVCHGRFLSPAEFVKHAGGGDVAHPLRHIIVNPARSSFS